MNNGRGYNPQPLLPAHATASKLRRFCFSNFGVPPAVQPNGGRWNVIVTGSGVHYGLTTVGDIFCSHCGAEVTVSVVIYLSKQWLNWYLIAYANMLPFIVTRSRHTGCSSWLEPLTLLFDGQWIRQMKTSELELNFQNYFMMVIMKLILRYKQGP